MSPDGCDWCGGPPAEDTPRLCRRCSMSKPGDLIRAAMNRMLARSAARRPA